MLPQVGGPIDLFPSVDRTAGRGASLDKKSESTDAQVATESSFSKILEKNTPTSKASGYERIKADVQPVSKIDTPSAEKFEEQESSEDVEAQVLAAMMGMAPATQPTNLISNKEKAMQAFMNTLQEKFNVAPEKVLEAFSKMSASALEAPAETTVDQFVNNLNISDSQKPQVAALYRELLKKTEPSQDVAISYEVLNQRDVLLQDLDRSITKLNDVFAMRNEPQMVAPKGVEIKSAENKKSEAMLGAMASTPAPIAKEAPTATGSTSVGAAEPVATLASVLPMASAAVSGSVAKVDTSTGQDDFEDSSAFGENLKKNSESAENFQARMSQFGQQTTDAVVPKNTLNQQGLKKYSAQPETVRTESLSTTETAALAAPQLPATPKAVPAMTAPMLPNVAPSMQDRIENVQEIIQKAQVMARDGGGEMRMELKPEGLGHVNLKVLVQDGQVHIQMVTENDKSKRMLEDGLGELKHNLLSHKLSVDTLKVDLADGFQKHFGQNPSDTNRDAAREFASQFMGQFREDRETFRQGFSDPSGWGPYNRQQRRMAMQPEPVNQPVNGSSRSANASRRLDLVA